MVRKPKHTFSPRKVVLSALALLTVVITLIVSVATRPLAPQVDANEPPPSLETVKGIKGSFVNPEQGYLQYQPSDRPEFLRALPGLQKKYTGTVIGAGTNYLFVDKEISMGEIFRGIDPVANRLILAYYSSGEQGRKQGFYTYPKGPFTDTYEIRKQDLDTFKIPANRGVVVLTEKDTVSYGLISPAQMTSTALSIAANSAPIDAQKGGWVLLPSNTAKIANMVSLYRDRVASAWALTSRNTFERVENIDTFSFSKYFLVWLKLVPASEATKTPEKALPDVITTKLPTHAENLKTLSKYLKWERVNGSLTQDGNTGDLTVKYKIFVDNYNTVTEKNIRVEILRNPHWGEKAWQIVREGPYNLQIIDGNIKLAQNSSSFEEQKDGSLIAKVRIPFPGIPLPSDTTEWGKVDVDFVFSDAANTPVVITSKYVTEEIARPNPIVVAGDGEVYFKNLGPGTVPANYFKKIVFYSSGGENATSLYNIFKDKKSPWWSGSESNWYNLDIGSKNWLLYDKDGHNYDEDEKGHIGLPTIYSVNVAGKDQD